MKEAEKIHRLLEYFHAHRGEAIDSYDTRLQELLEIGQRQLARELSQLHMHYDEIVETKKGRRRAYKLVRRIDLFSEAYKNKMRIGMLFEMAKDGMPEIIDTWQEISKKDSRPYLFFNMPYEEIDKLEKSPIFRSLKSAIERHEYRTIHLKGDKKRVFEDIKPIRLLFSEGNWYVAYVDTEEQLRLSRVNFIEKVDYSKKNSYQPKSVEKYLKWLEEAFQNSFSRYGVPKQTATLYAKPNIAHYFDKGMKRFFRSQRFVEKDANGGVTFRVDYTQEMEILPFVQRWMPDLLIVAPTELKEAYRKKLQAALDG